MKEAAKPRGESASDAIDVIETYETEKNNEIDRLIDGISKNKILQTVSRIINQQNESVEIVAISERKEFWENASKSLLDLNSQIEKITETVEFFYNYFAPRLPEINLSNLSRNCAFAQNIIGHSATDKAIAARVMSEFCVYMGLLAQKEKDLQITNLESFPPKSLGEIFCLGGTGERIEKLIQNLKVKKQDLPVIEIHDLLVSKMVDDLRYWVKQGSHIHILPYLNYALGVESAEKIMLRDPTFKAPQLEIPAYLLQKFLTEYCENFKSEIKRRVEYLENKIAKICRENEPDDLYLEIAVSRKFESLGIDSSYYSKFCQEDENGKNYWDEKEINNFLLEFLPLRISDGIFQQITQARKLPGEELFGPQASREIAELLMSENAEELLSGLDSLWSLSIRNAGNSTYISYDVINYLGRKNESIEEQLARTDFYLSLPSTKNSQTRKNFYFLGLAFLSKNLSEKLDPNQRFKVAEIISNYKIISGQAGDLHALIEAEEPSHQTNLLLSFSTLFISNPPLYLIEHFFIPRILSNIVQESTTLTLNDFSWDTIRNFLSRPDHLDILSLVKDTFEFSERSLSGFLYFAARTNNFMVCSEHLLQEVYYYSGLFSMPTIKAAIENRNPELLNLILHKGGKYLINRYDENLITPMHYAAITNSVESIDVLLKHGANLFILVHSNNAELSGYNALHLATKYGSFSFAKDLCENLAFNLVFIGLVNSPNNYGESPFHIAIQYNQTEILELIIKKNQQHFPDPNYNNLLKQDMANYSLYCGQLECFKTIHRTFEIDDPEFFISRAFESAKFDNIDFLEYCLKNIQGQPFEVYFNSEISEKSACMIGDYNFFTQISDEIFSVIIDRNNELFLQEFNEKNIKKIRDKITAQLVTTYHIKPDKLMYDLNFSNPEQGIHAIQTNPSPIKKMADFIELHLTIEGDKNRPYSSEIKSGNIALRQDRAEILLKELADRKHIKDLMKKNLRPTMSTLNATAQPFIPRHKNSSEL